MLYIQKLYERVLLDLYMTVNLIDTGKRHRSLLLLLDSGDPNVFFYCEFFM